MSWATAADSFTKGFAIGERMAENKRQRKMSEAFSAYQDAQNQPEPEVGAGIQVRPTAEDANTAPAGIDPKTKAVSDGTGLGINLKMDYKVDPAFHDNKRAATDNLLKAVGNVNPILALQLKKTFGEQDRKEFQQSLISASAALEQQDYPTMMKSILHGYGMIDDGHGAQMRMLNGPDGQRIPTMVTFDKKTGAMGTAVPITPEFLQNSAMAAGDPEKWLEFTNMMKQSKREDERLGLARDAGVRADRRMTLDESTAKKQSKLFGVQLRAAELALKNAPEDRKLKMEVERARMQMYKDSSTASMYTALARAGYGGSLGGMSFAQGQQQLKALESAVKVVGESFPEDSAEALFMQKIPAAKAASIGLASSLMSDNVNVDGKPLNAQDALRYAISINMREARTTGALKSDNADEDDIFENADIKLGPNKDDPTDTAVYAALTMPNGNLIQLKVDPNLLPGTAARIAADAKKAKATAAPGSPEAQEADGIIRALGRAVKRGAVNLERNQTQYSSSDEDLRQAIPDMYRGAVGGMSDAMSDFDAGYSEEYP